MIYQWRCTECGYDQDSPDAAPCHQCGGRTTRVYTVNFSRSSANAEEVWNPSLGIAHRTDAQAKEHIKRLNDEQGTHYVLGDPGDAAMF